ncbi:MULTISPECIES: hypothetical protein [Metallosphaera]|uniref:Uncharacterized protein n=4 Tax=Metallosphaera TaxID=41980 RepID=A4YGL4_METS5|nr:MULTISPECIES: hypothetical protein [Metallosphaera]ABP95566.1 hypothetical protein Msed_1408 [Metallosphaera sedula DSM 5348]AIM27550.1 hypothetical protein HA72_1408 [Metallosphaera sedula]AKV74412.1 hypothetical protein MsedA_1427 [Metallosphaera sedula]AKV76651.1 hypothetical protein MsedB_1429 [Metallosphaera sedula]AKV78903.1 hypothetical protein MsedC_1427 [Metallosphaera sedula]
MIIKPSIQWASVSSLTAPYIYWRDVIVILENPTKVFVVDAWRDQLGRYKPPSQLSIFRYSYRIGQVDEENTKYLECIANTLQTKLRPLIQRKYDCKDVVVML